MNLLKIAVGMNFLAAALFMINAGISFYNGKENFYQHLILALMFLVLAFFYKRKYKQKLKEEE